MRRPPGGALQMTECAHLGKLPYVRHLDHSSAGAPAEGPKTVAQDAVSPVSTTAKTDSNPWIGAIGRIPVVDVSPTIEQGRWAAKAVVGEPVPIRATVFREGHDAVAATAVLIDPAGNVHTRAPMVDVSPGNELLEASGTPGTTGAWTCGLEGWADAQATWTKAADDRVPV